jgi:hypothetical protein
MGTDYKLPMEDLLARTDCSVTKIADPLSKRNLSPTRYHTQQMSVPGHPSSSPSAHAPNVKLDLVESGT